MACECELQNTLDVEVTQDALLDVEIGGSAGVLLQAKSVEITKNGTSVVAPDDGFDGLKSVEINTNVPKRFECGDATFEHPASGATSIINIRLLKTINMSCWDTSKVNSFRQLFANFTSLQSLDVSGWDTSNVTSMYEVFSHCHNLKYVDVSNWNTSKVTNMSSAFSFCQSLQSIDVSKWDTSSCTSMACLFRGSISLKSVNLSGFDVSNVTDFSLYFDECKSLRTIIGDKTLQDVENGTVALRGTKVNIKTNYSPLRFSSILALANGLADLTGSTAQTLHISKQSYNNMYNDDDTKPAAEVIAERRARIAAICAAKNWNFTH